MRNVNVFFLVLILTICLISEATATVYRVPADYATLSAALNRASRASDTVLVANGVWSGNGNNGLSYRTGRVTLISENGPRECIIDGQGSANTAITMDGSCELSGFTIRRFERNAIIINGERDFNINNCLIESNTNDSTWSAVRITGNGCRGDIKFCSLRNNSSRFGGAIRITSNAEVTIESCWFSNNNADSIGGAIYLSGSAEATIFNCLFTGNDGYIHGGAVAATGAGSDAEITFTNFLNNEATMGWGGAIYKDGSPRISVHNCILWGNTAEYGNQIATRDNPEQALRLTLTHCIVEGGDGDGQNGNWIGDDIILEQVRYERSQRDPLWGPSNYFQREGSVSIDAGSDAAEALDMQNFTTRADLVADEGTVDIGFHYDLDLFPPIGTLFGVVLDAEDGSPMQGVDVITSLDQYARTTADGEWTIAGALAELPFFVVASFPGYNDSIIVDQMLPEEERLEINFGLLHPEFEISAEELSAASELGDSGNVDFSISNTGNGTLEWNSKLELMGDFNVEPWTPRETFYVGAEVDDGIGGVAFANGHYYFTTAHGNDSQNFVFKMDIEGALVDSFHQPKFSRSRTGALDIAYDGENFWTVESDSVYGFTPEGERIIAFRVRSRPTKCIAWDSENELLRVGYSTSDIIAYTREGVEVEDQELDRMGTRFRGLAYWPDDPDGFNLYLMARRSNNDPTRIIKMNTETNDTILVHQIQYQVGNPTAGFITSQMDPYSVVFMFIAEAPRGDGGDRIEVLTMASNTTWMMLDSTEGFIGPESMTPLTLTLYNEQFDYGNYRGLLTIFHNAVGEEVSLPVYYSVAGVPWNDPYVPKTTTIESTYPNPFNAETSINYTLSNSGWVTMTIYDLAGREIDVVMEDFQVAGRHNLHVNASAWSTGVYLAKLQSGNDVRIAKLVCVK